MPRTHTPVRTALALACLLALPAQAAVFIVNSTQDVNEATPGDGNCNPVGGVGNTCTLRAAIQEANALGGSHTIVVASGTYALTRVGFNEDAALNGDLDITADITLINGTSNPPVVFGNNGDRVFDIHAGGRLRLENINVAGGLANRADTLRGGAFNVRADAALELERVVVSGNVANIGGAIYSDGTVEIVDSEFFQNAILQGGFVADGFINGAAILSRGPLSIDGSSFHGNGVVPGGEGFVTSGYTIHLRTGGPAASSAILVNSTIAENITRGIRSEQAPLEIALSTIANNSFRGLQFNRDLNNLGNVQLRVRGSVVHGHSGGDCNGLVGTEAEYDLRSRHNASGDESCGFSGATDRQNIPAPFFGPLANHGGRTPVLLPLPWSALVDTGGLLCLPFVDQRDKTRPIDGDLDFESRCDIGAVEFDPESDPIPPDELFGNGFE
jgi:CSLREA domain-containing protein